MGCVGASLIFLLPPFCECVTGCNGFIAVSRAFFVEVESFGWACLDLSVCYVVCGAVIVVFVCWVCVGC